MKKIIVLRHAKSSWKHHDVDDFERPLNKRGKEDAPLAGLWLKGENLIPDRILCSSAKRARSTAKRVIASSGFNGDITYHTELYLAAPDAYIRFLRKLPDTVGCAMVIGHNPGLEALVEYLTAKSALMPTAAIAVVEAPIVQWEDLELNGKAILLDMWRPNEEDV